MPYLITPPPNDFVAGLPIDFWANLPLIACFTFGIIIVIGLIVIIRKNRQMADLHRKMDATNQQKEQ